MHAPMGHPTYTPKLDERTPPQVVAESHQPATALMEFVAQGLERDGFDLSTSHFPRLLVTVTGHVYAIGVGATLANPEKVSVALRRALAMLGDTLT